MEGMSKETKEKLEETTKALVVESLKKLPDLFVEACSGNIASLLKLTTYPWGDTVNGAILLCMGAKDAKTQERAEGPLN